MAFVLSCLVGLATLLTSAYWWPNNTNKVITIWMATITWWVAFMYFRGQTVDAVRCRLIDTVREPTQRRLMFEALPEYTVMLYSPRFFHLWTYQQWKAYADKHYPLEVEDQEGNVVARTNKGKWE